MNDRALMQMALDAFEAIISEGWSYCGPERTSKAQTAFYEATLALRERLAQPDYKQTRLNLCGVCGWDAVVPGEGCLNCKRLIKPENNADYERGFIDGRQDQMRSSLRRRSMIKDIRVVEWLDETENFRWEIQVMLEGSDEWKPATYVWLKNKPERVACDIEAKLKEKNA